jgi:hypothetical protein
VRDIIHLKGCGGLPYRVLSAKLKFGNVFRPRRFYSAKTIVCTGTLRI